MANAASLIDVCLAFEKEERRREKKQEALELEWLALDNAQEVLDAQQEAKEREAEGPNVRRHAWMPRARRLSARADQQSSGRAHGLLQRLNAKGKLIKLKGPL